MYDASIEEWGAIFDKTKNGAHDCGYSISVREERRSGVKEGFMSAACRARWDQGFYCRSTSWISGGIETETRLSS